MIRCLIKLKGFLPITCIWSSVFKSAGIIKADKRHAILRPPRSRAFFYLVFMHQTSLMFFLRHVIFLSSDLCTAPRNWFGGKLLCVFFDNREPWSCSIIQALKLFQWHKSFGMTREDNTEDVAPYMWSSHEAVGVVNDQACVLISPANFTHAC